MRTRAPLWSALAVLAAVIGCGGTGGDEGMDSGDEDVPVPDDPEEVIDQAREELPTYLDLHTKVIARTCSPDEGVCHHAKEYPDLTSPQAMLGAVGSACNVAVDDPLSVFNGCEGRGDEVRFPEYGSNQNWSTEIAWTETVETSLPGESGTDVVVHLRDAVPNPMNAPAELETIFVWRVYDDAEVEMSPFYGSISYEADEKQLTVHLLEAQNDNQQALLADGLQLGDPNQDDVFGADEPPFSIVAPGDPDQSYLLGRLLGRLPGTPMPLANQPLSSAEVLALTCWIEGLDGDEAPDVYGEIDYDECQAAADFGQGDPESGHSFSQDVQPILERCTGGGCHDEGAAEGLDLREGEAYENLLHVSSQDPATLRVTPGNPTNSYLMMKLRGTQISGLRMPREAGGEGEPLPEEELRVIEEWIIAGAPDD